MIYLDHNATSPLHPFVMEAMRPYFFERAGNPASVHGVGRAARQGLDEARRHVAALFSVHESQVIFTSGGTESNCLALFGIASRFQFQGHLIVSAIEHPSVLEASRVLERRGMTVTRIFVDAMGRLSPDALSDALREETRLVSVMHANNETGVLQPIRAIGERCREKNILFHTDAVQSVGKLPIDFPELSVGLLSASAHKFGGPKGTGALILDKQIALEPLFPGGGQERGRRSGTENLPGIVGFGAVAAWAQKHAATESRRVERLRNDLEKRLQDALSPHVTIFSGDAPRLPNTLAMGLRGLLGETLVMAMDLEGFAISAGSACSSGKVDLSHVPKAMGVEASLAKSMVRVSLGWTTTEEDLDRFLTAFVRVVERLRSMSSEQ